MPGILPVLLLVLLTLFICALALPLFIGIGLVIRKHRKVGLLILCIYAIVIGLFLLTGTFARRSTPGRIMRWCRGAGLAQQKVEDQVEDLRNSSSLSKIQSWAIDTIARFHAGLVRTNGPASYWSLGSVQLAPSEIPDFVLAQWKDAEPPEVSIGLSPSGTPSSVVVAWYLKGVVIGDGKYQLSIQPPDHAEEAAPGVYVYYLYK